MISNGIRMGMKITFPFLSGAARENEEGVRGALNPTIYWVINFLVRIPFVSLSCSAFCSPHCAKVQKYERVKIGIQFFDM